MKAMSLLTGSEREREKKKGTSGEKVAGQWSPWEHAMFAHCDTVLSLEAWSQFTNVPSHIFHLVWTHLGTYSIF